MAEFVASPITSAGSDPDAFWDAQKNSLASIGTQQFRDNTQGLVAGDPTATAAALAGDPTATTNYINVAGPNQRAQAAANVGATGSLAAATLNAPPDQRAAVYGMGRQALASAGYPAGALPPEDYPGDSAMLQLRAQSLPVPDQLKYTPQPLSANPVPLLQSVPGGGQVGPGGAVNTDGSTSASGITATPLSPPGQTGGQISAGGVAPLNPALAQAESSGNPGIVNKQGYAGWYQFGVPRLTSLGLYQPADNENPQANQWQGTFNIPGQPQVKTLQDFLGSPAAQNVAYSIHQNDIDQAIAATPGADKFDVNGLRGIAHLGGVGAMQQFVASGGQNGATADANGTTLAAYYRRFSGSGGQPVRLAQNVPPGGLATDATQAPAGPQNRLAGTLDALRAQQPAVAPVSGPATPLQPTGAPAAPSATSPQGAAPATAADPTVTPVDSPALAQLLPAGTQYVLPDGTVGVRPGLQPPAASAPNGSSLPAPFSLAALGSLPDSSSAAPSAASSPPGSPIASGGPGTIQNALNQPAAPAVPGTLQNALANVGAGQPLPQSQPNGLASLGQPQSTAGVGQAPQYPFVRDPMTRGYVPVPGQAGFAYAQGPGGVGDLRAQRIPGSPGAGVDTKVEGGMIISTDKQTGAIVSATPNVAPNTARVTAVNDGNTVHLYQPGSGEVGSVAAQPNVQGVQAQIYAEDRKAQGEQIDVAQQAQQQQVKLLEARQAMQGLPTGAGGDARTAWANWAETYLPTSWAQQFKSKLSLPDAVPAQEFGKLMTQSAGQQERSVAGARGGIGMMTLFKENNPGLNMQPNANRDLLNAQLVATQADADYAKGFVGFVNDNGQKLINRQGYVPASQFDQQWLQQRNPQVYTASAEAMNNSPFAFWSKGLSPADAARAMQIIGRIDPTMTVQGKNGPLAVRQFLGAQ